MNQLESARLTLVPVRTANAAVLWQIMQSPGLREFQDVPRIPRADFERRVASRPRRFDGRLQGRFEWLIVPRIERRPVGWVSLRVGEGSPGVAEIGYSVIVGARGCGYAGEAVRELLGVAFEARAIERVEACCLPGNVASRRLLARVGFREVRLQRSGAVVRGGPVDILVFELERSAWTLPEPSRAANAAGNPASAKP
ncbi:MAG: GNAT family N-acetyltransferase [Vulcanimicrobiaceae bacterium]